MSTWMNNLLSAVTGLFKRRQVVVQPHPAAPPVVVIKPSVAKTVATHPVTKAATVAVTATAAAWLVVATPFVASFEGYFGHAYRDIAGVQTICYGQTAADGADFSKVYTKDECLKLLQTDLQKYDRDVKRLLTPSVYAALSPRRHASLVSFDYNLGAGNLAHITPYFNRGNYVAGCNAMLAFDKARVHGSLQRVSGLTRRRQAERQLCLRND